MKDIPAVSAKNIDKSYGPIEALKDITLRIEPGEIYGLLGANGAGKTTFIKLLVGATKANNGELRLFNIDPVKSFHELHSKIGYMPQTPALYGDLSAAENVRFIGQAHDIENLDARVQATLEFVGLSKRSKYKVETFSGGMKQRLSLACALVHEPELLLLDEPTAGVDVKLRSAFWKHFRELANQGVSFLVSTHQMDEAIHCDRLAILREGQLLVESGPHELLHTGSAQIKIWRKGKSVSHTVRDYPRQLPKILQDHHLDPGIDRIEIHVDSLEQLVLDLIDPEEKGKQ